MKPNSPHSDLLRRIKRHSGKPTQHTFLDSYLGTSHPRYPINIPTLRNIGREWLKENKEMPVDEFKNVLTSLLHGKSSTEKTMAGILLNLSARHQQEFDPIIFNDWLEHLEGWAEVDGLCTGRYADVQLLQNFDAWKKILTALSKSDNIHKRRASLVFLCSPLRKEPNLPLVTLALRNVDRLSPEKHILITKAISWVLRNGVVWHKPLIKKYVILKKDALPKIAVRETLTKINTGKKTKSKMI
jgi:3-methyladenine DNA glycosylase AlkD